jgi:hypothetical protein
MPPRPNKKGKTAPVKREEEITFDRAARTEYLTGFHKRKLQRIKAAKETAAAIEKQAKAEAKKQVCIAAGRGEKGWAVGVLELSCGGVLDFIGRSLTESDELHWTLSSFIARTRNRRITNYN